MKYQQQVTVDLVNMVYTAIAYLALAGAAWLFLRLIQACFWLPSHIKRQNDVQRMLQEKVNASPPIPRNSLTFPCAKARNVVIKFVASKIVPLFTQTPGSYPLSLSTIPTS